MKRKYLALVAVLLGVSATAYLLFDASAAGRFGDSVEGITHWLQSLPPALAVALFGIGPLLGLPLSVFLIALAMAYPLPVAIVITTATLLLHHLLVYLASRTAASGWLQSQLAKRKLLPVSRGSLIDDALFIATAAWVPGASYFLKLIYTVLAGTSLWVYLAVGTVSQLIAAMPFLLVGHLADSGSVRWVLLALFALVGLAWLGRILARNSTRQGTDYQGKLESLREYSDVH